MWFCPCRSWDHPLRSISSVGTVTRSSMTPFYPTHHWQGGGSGEEQLCADFPELDLSQLDASDFDSATCFEELQWRPENSETEPSQYSPDDPELFQVCPLEPRCLSLPLKARLCPEPSSSTLAHAKKSHHQSSRDPVSCPGSTLDLGQLLPPCQAVLSPLGSEGAEELLSLCPRSEPRPSVSQSGFQGLPSLYGHSELSFPPCAAGEMIAPFYR
nr:uncharacterized protein LOC115850312 [Globicephala melas]